MRKKKSDSEIDILPHKLMPELKILNKKEAELFYKEYNTSQDLIPKMFSTDPAAVAIKAKIGDLIQIKRKDYTGNYTYYRIIIEGELK